MCFLNIHRQVAINAGHRFPAHLVLPSTTDRTAWIGKGEDSEGSKFSPMIICSHEPRVSALHHSLDDYHGNKKTSGITWQPLTTLVVPDVLPTALASEARCPFRQFFTCFVFQHGHEVSTRGNANRYCSITRTISPLYSKGQDRSKDTLLSEPFWNTGAAPWTHRPGTSQW